MRYIKRLMCTTAVCGLALGFGSRVSAAEFGANSPYYEDDAWYDITEWFDGNDYNPTDETWWRWDDEVYQARKDTGVDTDNDGWYGYSGGQNSAEWYYDYYDPYVYSYYNFDGNDTYEVRNRYYDYDNDGLYDAYSSSADLDNDGRYEDYVYYSFNDAGSEKQKQQVGTDSARESRQRTVNGTIRETKLVEVRGGAKHLVASIQPSQGNTNIVADLGKAENLKGRKLKQGDQLTVKGPSARVGEKTVILARSVSHDGRTMNVDRNQRTMTGHVMDTHKATIRGQEHLIAIVQPSKQNKAQQIAVDLGPADQLDPHIKKGRNLTFTGFPVKVQGKQLVIAQSVQGSNNQTVQINRERAAMGGAESPGNTQSGKGSEGKQRAGTQDNDESHKSQNTQKGDNK